VQEVLRSAAAKSGLINKYTVKHTAAASYSGLGTICGSRRGQCFIFGALYPSKSGSIRNHTVKHIVIGWLADGKFSMFLDVLLVISVPSTRLGPE